MDIAFPAERHRRPRIRAATTPAPDFGSEEAAIAWLDTERSGLVAIAAYASANGWPTHAIRLSETLFRHLDTGGHYAEGTVIHEQARRAAAGSGDAAAEARASTCLGIIDGHQSRYRQAGDRLKHALALHGEAGDQDGQARALNYLGPVHVRQGRLPEALSDLEQAATLFHAVGERTGEAYALSNLGVINRRQGHYQQATELQQQALAVFQQLGDRHGEATILDRLGLVVLDEGNHQRRFPCNSRHWRRSARSATGRAGRTCWPDWPGSRRGRADTSRRPATCCGHWHGHQDMGDASSQAETLNRIGEVLLATGDPAEARARHAAALNLATGGRRETRTGKGTRRPGQRARGDR